MSTVYLQDGSKAQLVQKLESSFLVNPYMIYLTNDGEYGDAEYEDLSGNLRIVDKVFDKAPVESINAEYQGVLNDLNSKIEEKKIIEADIRAAKKEFSDIQQKRTNLSKLIFDKSYLKEAKTIIVFKKDTIEPFIMDNRSSLKITLSYEITQYKAEERAWVYQFYFNNFGSGDYYDAETGILCDLIDEEILKVTFERQQKQKISDRTIQRTDDKWLTPENIEIKNRLNKEASEQEISKLEKTIEESLNRLSTLKSK